MGSRLDSSEDESFSDDGRTPGGSTVAEEASRTWNGSAGWQVFFPGDNESDPSNMARAAEVSALAAFFASPPGRTRLAAIPPSSFALPLDYAQLAHPSSAEPLRRAASALTDAPDDVLAAIGLAACRAVEAHPASSYPQLMVIRQNKLIPRIYNFSPLTPLRKLRGNSVGKFVSVRGTVVRVSNTRQQVVSMDFECSRCGEIQNMAFVDYKFSPPVSCRTKKCRSRSFQPLRDTTETVDWQKIRIQEIQDRDDDANREEGRMPRTIDAELFSDLIDTCIPGDIAVVNGAVRVLTMEGVGGGGGKNARAAKCLYYMYIEANSISTSRNGADAAAAAASGSLAGQQMLEMETLHMHQLIHDILQQPDPFSFLVHSTVPSIYGHEIVKAGMLLSLFGGAPKIQIGPTGDSETVSIRRDIHCLVVGDPGLGKSQMLKSISRIAPRGVYVCGNTTTAAGLTVTVVRESSGDFALEAGALVLSDRGVCCIDEFDKMGSEHAALLEAMEQQSVSVAKAGLLCNLSARTTVIAAANPVGGHYDRSRTVCENLKIALPLLSRFDLVFILLDNPDEDRDRFISEHVMKMFGMRNTKNLQSNSSVGRSSSQAGTYRTQSNGATQRGDAGSSQRFASHQSVDLQSNNGINGEHDLTPRESLKKRLRATRVSDPLPASVFRQYITYARTHVHPELSHSAKQVLQDFYLTLRKGAKEQSADTTPITTRQLESLIRLSEARARAVMRTTVTAGDARDVIEVMRESMLETLTDETGKVDLGRASGMSRAKDARRFVAALHSEAARSGSAVFDRARLRRIADAIGIAADRFDTLIETINYQGYVTKKRAGTWLLQSSSFSQGSSL